MCGLFWFSFSFFTIRSPNFHIVFVIHFITPFLAILLPVHYLPLVLGLLLMLSLFLGPSIFCKIIFDCLQILSKIFVIISAWPFLFSLVYFIIFSILSLQVLISRLLLGFMWDFIFSFQRVVRLFIHTCIPIYHSESIRFWCRFKYSLFTSFQIRFFHQL